MPPMLSARTMPVAAHYMPAPSLLRSLVCVVCRAEHPELRRICMHCLAFFNAESTIRSRRPSGPASRLTHADAAAAATRSTLAAFCRPECRRCATEMYQCCSREVAALAAEGVLVSYAALPPLTSLPLPDAAPPRGAGGSAAVLAAAQRAYLQQHKTKGTKAASADAAAMDELPDYVPKTGAAAEEDHQVPGEGSGKDMPPSSPSTPVPSPAAPLRPRALKLVSSTATANAAINAAIASAVVGGSSSHPHASAASTSARSSGGLPPPPVHIMEAAASRAQQHAHHSGSSPPPPPVAMGSFRSSSAARHHPYERSYSNDYGDEEASVAGSNRSRRRGGRRGGSSRRFSNGGEHEESDRSILNSKER